MPEPEPEDLEDALLMGLAQHIQSIDDLAALPEPIQMLLSNLVSTKAEQIPDEGYALTSAMIINNSSHSYFTNITGFALTERAVRLVAGDDETREAALLALRIIERLTLLAQQCILTGQVMSEEDLNAFDDDLDSLNALCDSLSSRLIESKREFMRQQ
jgi:hypothetical protein